MQKVSREYLLLFNTITDTEESLRQLRARLIDAQRQAEELYIQQADTDPLSRRADLPSERALHGQGLRLSPEAPFCCICRFAPSAGHGIIAARRLLYLDLRSFFPLLTGPPKKLTQGTVLAAPPWYPAARRSEHVHGRSHHAVYRLSPVLLQGLRGHGPPGAGAGGEHLSVLHPQPKRKQGQDLDEADAAALRDLLAERGFGPIVAHAPYTLNLCGAEEKNRLFARETMADDLRRLEHLPGQLYNFHPGSHVGQGIEAGIDLIAQGLNAILRPEQSATVLLETMAGKGSEVGGRFEELRAILDRVTLSDRMGVCLDTCHVSDAGYDLVGDLDGVLTEFDRVIGLEKLRAVHLNDSKNPPGSRKDRHACLGEGTIGLEALTRIVRHPALKHLPFCLETPNDLPGYAREIALMRELAET